MRSFLPQYSFSEQVLAYSVVGGVPAYLNAIDPTRNLEDNIRMTFLQKDHVLFEEPEQLLRMELREPKQYENILEAVAFGNTRVVTIANSAGMNAKDLPIYLKTLIKLGILDRTSPITERKANSRHAIYRLKDPFFKFWFRFVQPFRSRLEIGGIEEVVEVIQKGLFGYASATFEGVCRQFIEDSVQFSSPPTQIGTWWQKDAEIDIICLNPVNNHILFGECKWQDNVNGLAVLAHLRKTASLVPWNLQARQDNFMIFAKSFKQKPAPTPEVKFIDIKNMQDFYDR